VTGCYNIPNLACTVCTLDAHCDDGDACTTDVCLPGTGCQHTALVCDDGDRCTMDACVDGLGCVATPICPGCVTLEPSQDVWIEDTANNNGTDYLKVGQVFVWWRRRTLIQFPVTALPEGQEVFRATLWMMHYTSGGDSHSTGTISRPISVNRILKPWVETVATRVKASSTLNWADSSLAVDGRDASATAEDVQVLTPYGYGWKQWDVTAAASLWAADPATNFGLLLWATNEERPDLDFWFRPRHHADASLRPNLVIAWGEANPEGGRPLGCIECLADADCDDADACTADTCSDGGTCQHEDVSAACDDGSACTANTCVPATGCQYPDDSARCLDDNECTDDSCDPATGCVHTPVGDGTACDDEIDCTNDDACAAGVCAGVPQPGCLASCFDGVCRAEDGENCSTCAAECGPCEGDCCLANGSPGCEDQAVSACVCAELPFCCADTWYPVCAAQAVSACGAVCHGCGDGECADGETCATCPDDCGACPGDCCVADGTPGCTDAAVSACVCQTRPACCSTAWNAECVTAAAACGAGCSNRCGDGSCDPEEGCDGCPADCGACAGDCCTPHPETRGCGDADVAACVCDLDPYCCRVGWDDLCAGRARVDCGEACRFCGDDACDAAVGEDCVTCPGDCGVCPGDCCTPHGTPGCQVPAVVTAVCALDPFCCGTAWDAACVAAATHGPSGAHCQRCGDGACVGPVEIEDCPEDCGPYGGDCCYGHDNHACENPTVAACVCALDQYLAQYCCTYQWADRCVTYAARYCGADCHRCGDFECDPAETCHSCAGDCGGCTGDCCAEHDTPGCADGTVRACVCAADPYCCTHRWDGWCALLAAESCGAGCAYCADGVCEGGETCATCPQDCGACPYCGDGECAGDENTASCPVDCGVSREPCCVEHDGPGCEDAAVQACVCGDDYYWRCCSTVWDEWDLICVYRATQYCGLACPACGDGTCDPDEGETRATCPADCGLYTPHCCAESSTPGCSVPSIANCVCNQEFPGVVGLPRYCCSLHWDDNCVEKASTLCGRCQLPCGDQVCGAGETCSSCPEDCGLCPWCGDDVCNGAETCVSCRGDCGDCAGDCCAAHGGEGCDHRPTAACVCALDPTCCTEGWDAACVELAETACGFFCPVCGDGTCDDLAGGEDCALCPEDCGDCDFCGDGACNGGENCGTCPDDCLDCEGDCCVNDRTPGCEDPAIALVVCTYRPACCAETWDALCVALAEQVACDDRDPATVDACEPGTGCVHRPVE